VRRVWIKSCDVAAHGRSRALPRLALRFDRIHLYALRGQAVEAAGLQTGVQHRGCQGGGGLQGVMR